MTLLSIIHLFTPSTGTYDHTFANIYPVGDAFRYLVEWMSDNQMTDKSLSSRREFFYFKSTNSIS